MNINEDILEEILSNRKNKEEINIFNFQSLNINKIYSNNINLERIEYLCLKNNQLKNINFITSFPNLWYLDIRENFVKKYLIKIRSKTSKF